MPLAEKLILCIDNNASRNLAIYLLERVGFDVRTANSLADGIKKVQTQRFDLYLLNHDLLEGRQIESCDKLGEFAPRATNDERKAVERWENEGGRWLAPKYCPCLTTARRLQKHHF